MPCVYAWRDDCVIKTFHGFVSGLDFIQSTEVIAADPRFDGLRMIYNDLSTIDGHSIDAASYRRVAICRLGAMRTNPHFRVAFIAPGDMGRALHAACEGGRMNRPFDPHVCATMHAARLWFLQQPTLGRPRGGSSTHAHADKHR